MKDEQIEQMRALLKTRATREIYNDRYILFHGTANLFENIDLEKSSRYTDFGKGFYLTNIYEQAVDWAGKKRLIELGTFENLERTIVCKEEELPKAYVMKFEFHIEETLGLKKKIFNKYDEEWLKYVVQHRGVKKEKVLYTNSEQYDITIGPMADGGDELNTIVESYRDDQISKEEALEKIQFKKPTMQITFHTNEALKLLVSFGKTTTII